MLWLIKWAVYGAIGYAIYEFFAGMMETHPFSPGDDAGTGDLSRGSRSRPGVMTGSQGQGQFVPIADSSGHEHRAKVGRGIVR